MIGRGSNSNHHNSSGNGNTSTNNSHNYSNDVRQSHRMLFAGGAGDDGMTTAPPVLSSTVSGASTASSTTSLWMAAAPTSLSSTPSSASTSLSAARQHRNNDSSLEEVPYPPDFSPGPHHVICARGKSQWDHQGNKRYRAIITAATEKYAKASCKLDKSLIVSEIIESIEGSGGFIKKRKSDNRWIKCNEHFSREKVTQSLRDGLSNRYKSSTKAKKQRRSKFSAKISEDAEKVIHSNTYVSNRIQKLSNDIQSSATSDCAVCTMLTRANSDILESMKQDTDLLMRFQDATNAAKEK